MAATERGRAQLNLHRTVQRARNAYSLQLAASVRVDDVHAALGTVIRHLLPSDRGYLLRRAEDGWSGRLAGGEHGEAPADILVPASDSLDAVLADGICLTTRAMIGDQPADVLLVPAGPPSSETVLVLVPNDAVPTDDGVPTNDDLMDAQTHELATAIASEAWAALHRLEVLGELAAQRRATERLQSRDRQRADHVDGITHDLRSPVTAVLGFARTLSQAGDLLTPAERIEALETIERQSLRMSRMLDEMLDSARAEAGELRRDRRVAVPLHTAVADALATASPDRRERLRPDVQQVEVCGDADQLTRVVQNLIANALEYAPPGSPVEVMVRAEGGEGVVDVIDHGPGIPEGRDAFARFGRGGRGTGLGLYTVKRIVEVHDGTITLTQTPGGGTTMTVRLPLFDADQSG